MEIKNNRFGLLQPVFLAEVAIVLINDSVVLVFYLGKKLDEN